ncbi:uncharacterized protein LOC131226416 [Magnolia sinica]|uniref:uncharacterized protein LOC131226416 n=1 Tax=Magnolia sinica TaxID=86752 RepID=UPI002659139D|nr:uncharacterized protein LOC131226416 [Magnolia sinica]
MAKISSKKPLAQERGVEIPIEDMVVEGKRNSKFLRAERAGSVEKMEIQSAVYIATRGISETSLSLSLSLHLSTSLSSAGRNPSPIKTFQRRPNPTVSAPLSPAGTRCNRCRCTHLHCRSGSGYGVDLLISGESGDTVFAQPLHHLEGQVLAGKHLLFGLQLQRKYNAFIHGGGSHWKTIFMVNLVLTVVE